MYLFTHTFFIVFMGGKIHIKKGMQTTTTTKKNESKRMGRKY